MRQAIGYIRVSTLKQAKIGHGLDMQRIQIEAYAKSRGIRITQTMTDVASGMGEIRNVNLHAALKLAKENRWPIIVAGFDRIARNTKAFEEAVRQYGVDMISAQNGENVDPAVMQAISVRAQREGELISRRTTEALAERKAKGVKLGNRKNLADAQRRGAEANTALGKHRRAEFEVLAAEAGKAGAVNAREIADYLNGRGLRTARGGEWKTANVHRMLKEIDASSMSASARKRVSETSAPKPVFDPDGYPLSGADDRIYRIIERRGMKPGDVMAETGFKRLDASLWNALRWSRRVKPEMRVKVTAWVHANEIKLGLLKK